MLQTILNTIDFGMSARDAVAAPRFSSTGNSIDVSNCISRGATQILEAGGYEVIRNPYGYTVDWVYAIGITDGAPEGVVDPGRDGVTSELAL